jgi:hypothetical protein
MQGKVGAFMHQTGFRDGSASIVFFMSSRFLLVLLKVIFEKNSFCRGELRISPFMKGFRSLDQRFAVEALR